MSKSKDLHMVIRAEMEADIYTQIPDHLKEEMKLKSIEAENFKEDYRKDKDWQELNKKLIEAVKARNERQDEIRVKIRNK